MSCDFGAWHLKTASRHTNCNTGKKWKIKTERRDFDDSLPSRWSIFNRADVLISSQGLGT